MSIENMNIEQKKQDDNKEQIKELSSKELFSSLKKTEWISEVFFVKQIDSFHKNNPEWYKIFQTMISFLEKNNLDNTESVLSTILFVDQFQKEKWSKTLKFLKFQLKIKPAKIIEMINWFNDDVEKLNQKEELKNQKEELKNQTEELKTIDDKQWVKNIDKKLLQTINLISDKLISSYHFSKEKAYETAKKEIISIKKNESINKIMEDIDKSIFSAEVKKLKQEINQIKDPNLKKKINTEINQKEQDFVKAGVDKDQAYLLAFSLVYKTNENLRENIKLWQEETAVLANVEHKWWSLLVEEKAVGMKEVWTEITDFANSKTEYDAKIKESLDISWLENIKISREQQKYLSWKYPKILNKIFQQLVSKNNSLNEKQLEADYTKYLNWEETKEDKIFSVVWKKLLEYEVKQSTEWFVQEYKQLAMKEYTKSIFAMFDKAVGTENIKKNFKKTDQFDIKENGNIDLNFNYKNTPLDFKITADGDIKMTNYVARDGINKETWPFQKKETKLNNFFNIVSVKDLLQPKKINLQDLIQGKDLKWALQNQIKEQIKNKLEKNNDLGNQELMKTETKYEMERQSITYKMLNLYQPPQKVQNYLSSWNAKIWEQQDRWLFYFLWRIDKTLRMNNQAQNVLEEVLADEKFKSFFTGLASLKKIKTWEENTYNIFKTLWFMGKNWELDLKKIQKFKIKLNNVTKKSDLEWKEYHKFNWYKFIYTNDKVLLEDKNIDDDLFASLEQKFSNYSQIEI